MRRLRMVLGLAGAILFTLAGISLPTASATRSADPTPAPKKLFTIKDERIQGWSGLAKSQRHQGIYWTASSSGDSARVFAIDTTGEVKAALRFKAQLKDIEAVAVDSQGTIYVADIGDNRASREMVEVYSIPEPEKLEDSASVSYHRYDFNYPDGAHDAETLLVEPGTNQMYIVTKSSKGAGVIYAAPPSPSRDGTNELSKLAAAPAGVITGGTFTADGQRVVLRTQADLTTLAWSATPSVVARSAVPAGEGESVAVGPTATTVLLGGDTPTLAVYQAQVPAKQAAATPPATSATPKPPAGSEVSGSGDSAKSHNLQWIIGGAAAFALIITIITFPPGRRERLDRMAENARLTGQSPPTSRRRHQA